ncbi:hypothetical protein [Nitriliruptor alkaliphilus]|uniref:hypothetical protein n=1 Tax=Nitriliruptor alkaliphilus TaxID=427918 RepID=UPI0006972532|nr:hypothetical protein [Nitriliruptor alkaliphilus]
MDTTARRRSRPTLAATIALVALLATAVPAAADKGFEVTCDEVVYLLGSGTGLPSAKKDMDRTRGRWGTLDDPSVRTNSGFSLLPVSWTITVVQVDDPTNVVLVDYPLLTSNGHRNQDTMTCTFTSLLPAAPPEFPFDGLATHTLVVVVKAPPQG